MLVDTLGATHVSVGRELPLRPQGARATRRCCAADGRFETRVVPLVEVEGETVSSSHIRGLVAAGEVAHAIAFLGAAVPAPGRGRARRRPRARARLPDGQPRARRARSCAPTRRLRLPRPNGVPAAVNIGVRPTFETGRGVLVEAYLIDFEGDLYGSELRLDFLARLRGERRSTPSTRSSSRCSATCSETRELAG